MKTLIITLALSLSMAQAAHAAKTCSNQFKSASASISIADVSDAADLCQQSVEKGCELYVEKNSDGSQTGDGRLMAEVCSLEAAYGANVAVYNGSARADAPAHHGHATRGCERAYQKAHGSPSAGDVGLATDVCAKEKETECGKQEDAEGGAATGDGRWVGAACELTAQHGAAARVSRMNK